MSEAAPYTKYPTDFVLVPAGLLAKLLARADSPRLTERAAREVESVSGAARELTADVILNAVCEEIDRRNSRVLVEDEVSRAVLRVFERIGGRGFDGLDELLAPHVVAAVDEALAVVGSV